jgi:hypothetical protein
MGLKKLQLICDDAQPIYFGGQTVSGRLLVEIDEPKNLQSKYDDQTLHNIGATHLILANLC